MRQSQILISKTYRGFKVHVHNCLATISIFNRHMLYCLINRQYYYDYTITFIILFIILKPIIIKTNYYVQTENKEIHLLRWRVGSQRKIRYTFRQLLLQFSLKIRVCLRSKFIPPIIRVPMVLENPGKSLNLKNKMPGLGSP